MLWITESPWAASAASSIAMPARMSGLSTPPPWSGAGPASTARCGPHRTMRSHAQPLEPQQDTAEILAAHAVDRDRAVGDGGEPDERADLDVVRSHRAGGGREGRSAFDGERVRPDALDLRAQTRQKARQILN